MSALDGFENPGDLPLDFLQHRVPRLDPALWAWLLRFARRCNERDMLAAAEIRAHLLRSTGELYDELFDRARTTWPQHVVVINRFEQGLSGALGRLFALSEAYPDLKANENMMQLSEELTTTENKVAFARQAYNDSVMNYNTMRESFPNNFFAGWFNFAPAELLEIEDEAKREVPEVSFT